VMQRYKNERPFHKSRTDTFVEEKVIHLFQATPRGSCI
jgi:hypothetical protein